MYDLAAILKAKRLNRKTRRVLKLRGGTRIHEARLKHIYLRVVAYWRTRIRLLEPPQSMADAMPTPEQIENERAAAEAFLNSVIAQLMHWVDEAGEWTRKLWVSRIKMEYGVDIGLIATNPASNAAMKDAVNWATALIRDLSDTTRNKLIGTLSMSVAEGIPASEVASAIKRVLDTSAKRAEMIAHDQTQKIFSKLNEAQQREAGIKTYVWNHSFMPNPRRHHVERQGNTYSWDRPPRGGHPGTEINCRCTAAALVEA